MQFLRIGVIGRRKYATNLPRIIASLNNPGEIELKKVKDFVNINFEILAKEYLIEESNYFRPELTATSLEVTVID